MFLRSCDVGGAELQVAGRHCQVPVRERSDEDRKARQENRCDHAVQVELDQDHRGEDDSMKEFGSELR